MNKSSLLFLILFVCLLIQFIDAAATATTTSLSSAETTVDIAVDLANDFDTSTEPISTEFFDIANDDEITTTEIAEFEVTDTDTNNMENSTIVNNATQSTTSSPPRNCGCRRGTCTCCTGRLLQYFNRKACVKIRYIPDDFAFDIRMVMNNRTLYQNMVSGKNPRPICAAVPFVPIFSFCAEFYDIYFIRRNVNICLNMSGNLSGQPILRVNFNCLRFGANGIKLTAPDTGIDSTYGELDAIIDEGDDSGSVEYNEIVR